MDIVLEEIFASDSDARFEPRIIEVPVYHPERLFTGDTGALISSLYFLPRIVPLEVRMHTFSVLVVPHAQNEFVARAMTSRFNATGQGKTVEEALTDIKAAIELLLEEEANPSGNEPWPEDYQ